MQKQRSRSYQLVEDRLGRDLEDWVGEQRQRSNSWHAIAVELAAKTAVTVTPETLRQWFGSTFPGRSNAKAAS